MRYPQTKNEIRTLQDERIAWGVPEQIGKALFHYLIDLGAKHDLPTQKKDIAQYINRLHKKLTLENAHFPDDIPFDVIYPAFMSAVLNGFVEVSEYQSHSAKSQLSAFKKWITKGGQLDKLYQSWYSMRPEARPRQIESGSNGDLESWSDGVILDQYRKIRQVMGEEVEILKTTGAKNYFARIKNEVENRNLTI